METSSFFHDDNDEYDDQESPYSIVGGMIDDGSVDYMYAYDENFTVGGDGDESESDVLGVMPDVDTSIIAELDDKSRSVIADVGPSIIMDLDAVETGTVAKRSPKEFVELLESKEDMLAIVNGETFQHNVSVYNGDVEVGDTIEFVFDDLKSRRIITNVENNIAFWSKNE